MPPCIERHRVTRGRSPMKIHMLARCAAVAASVASLVSTAEAGSFTKTSATKKAAPVAVQPHGEGGGGGGGKEGYTGGGGGGGGGGGVGQGLLAGAIVGAA